MFSLTAQRNRKFNLQHALNIADSFYRQGFAVSEKPMVTIQGQTDAMNVCAFIAPFVELDKQYRIGERTIKGQELISKLEAYETSVSGKKFPVIAAGRHRDVALIVCKVVMGKDVTPTVVEVTADVAERISFEENANSELIYRLLASEKLAEVCELRKRGVYQREADLPFKRGTSQKLWAQSELVIVFDIPADKAGELDKEDARKAAKTTDVAAAVAAACEEKAGNAKKVLTGSKLRECLAMAIAADAEKKNAVTRLLSAICENIELEAKLVVKAALGIGVAPVVAEAPVAEAAKSKSKKNAA